MFVSNCQWEKLTSDRLIQPMHPPVAQPSDCPAVLCSSGPTFLQKYPAPTRASFFFREATPPHRYPSKILHRFFLKLLVMALQLCSLVAPPVAFTPTAALRCYRCCYEGSGRRRCRPPHHVSATRGAPTSSERRMAARRPGRRSSARRRRGRAAPTSLSCVRRSSR